MFDSICIRRQNLLGPPIDLGFLAEAMIFYKEVHVVADPGMLTYLVRTLGPDSLKAALSDGLLKVSFLESLLGVQTITDTKGRQEHRLVSIKSPKTSLEPYLEAEVTQLTGKRGKSRRKATGIARLISKMPVAAVEAQASAIDFHDPDFCLAAAKAVLIHIAPGFQLPAAPFFRTNSNGELFTVETNINIPEASVLHRALIPDSEPLTEARILIDIFNAGTDLRLAARLSSEMAVSPETSAIAQIRLSQVLYRSRVNEAELRGFQEWVFEDGRAISEAVNSRHRNFDDVLKVAAAARKFKEWIGTIPEDGNFRREYLRSVHELDWIDKLPPKSLRWILFTLAGALLGCLPPPIGGIAVVASGATDTFLFDNLVKGWKPNQFVQGPLRSFVEGVSNRLEPRLRLAPGGSSMEHSKQ